MKLSTEVSSDKLRGGFYTPEPLVNVCLNRADTLRKSRKKLTVLEPSAGDGAFLRCLVKHKLGASTESFVGIEILDTEARKCREAGRSAAFDVAVENMNTLEWAADTDDAVDVVVGNPPFVRYQFVSKLDLRSVERLGKRIGVAFRGVSNLWIPILIGSLSRLRAGGVMSLVVPAEIFTGLSAGDARAWLLENFGDLRVDMFAPGSFPGVLQEVVVLSGRRASGGNGLVGKEVVFAEHGSKGGARLWSHRIARSRESWTRYLLTPLQLDALNEAKSLPGVQAFGNVAKLEVSLVTGANDYFSVTSEQVERLQLHRWIAPLLPRIRHAEGLVYGREDHAANDANGGRAWLLDFGEQRPEPKGFHGAAEYIEAGEMQGLHKRYKTSIRSPWYRVPSVWAGKLMLSKRSHRFHRLILNDADALTTDTIYRGNLLPLYAGREEDLVGAFHNSLTLLTAEIEGRSFGGGVLELVPSEIARLSIPFPVTMADALPRLDRVSRASFRKQTTPAALVEATDDLLCRRVDGLAVNSMQKLQEARETLAKRRLDRN